MIKKSTSNKLKNMKPLLNIGLFVLAVFYIFIMNEVFLTFKPNIKRFFIIFVWTNIVTYWWYYYFNCNYASNSNSNNDSNFLNNNIFTLIGIITAYSIGTSIYYIILNAFPKLKYITPVMYSLYLFITMKFFNCDALKDIENIHKYEVYKRYIIGYLIMFIISIISVIFLMKN